MSLDFNDIAPTHENADRDAEREECVPNCSRGLESVLIMFPAGKKRRGKFLIGDVLGSPGDSLEVVLDGERRACGRIAPRRRRRHLRADRRTSASMP